MSLKERIRTLRQKRGINQKQLAEASGVTSSTISRIEKGQVKQLKLQTLLRLAHALDVPVDHLVNNTETIIPSELVRVDSTAEYILQRYEKLSARGREQLKNFVRFLAEQEESQAQGHV